MSASTATEAGKAGADPFARGRALADGGQTLLRRYMLPLAGAAVICVIGIATSGFHSGFPTNWVLGGGVPNWFDRLSNWVTDNQQTNFFLHHVIGGFANLLNDSTNWVIDLLNWMTWVGVLVVATVVAWLVGTWRTALFAALMVASFGVLQIPNGGPNGIAVMWSSAMTTLSLMAVSIILSTIVGIPLGIACAVWPSVHKALRPVLDLMQIMPAFAYLVPIVVLFSIGNPAGIVATFIYAVPPLVRFTELGIRSVRRDAIEAAQSFGATRSQVLRRIQLPLAGQSIMLGLNQVIMMALSIVVIASMVGAGGLGDPVLAALQNQEIGEGAVAGLLIVFMAMWLDRTSGAFGLRYDPLAQRRLRPSLPPGAARPAGRCRRDDPRRPVRAQSRRLAVVVGLLDRHAGDERDELADRAPCGGDRADLELPHARDPQPAAALAGRPAVVARRRGGVRNRLAARGGMRRGILLATCVVLLGLLQAPVGYTFQGTTSYDFNAWTSAMITLSLVLVALVLDLAVGIPLGIAAYRWRAVDQVLRPILDFLQTLPAFVYLILEVGGRSSRQSSPASSHR